MPLVGEGPLEGALGPLDFSHLRTASAVPQNGSQRAMVSAALRGHWSKLQMLVEKGAKPSGGVGRYDLDRYGVTKLSHWDNSQRYKVVSQVLGKVEDGSVH